MPAGAQGPGGPLPIATCRAGHDLHVVVRAAPALELLHQVLDVSEAVSCGKVQQDLALPLQNHLLEVLVPEGTDLAVHTAYQAHSRGGAVRGEGKKLLPTSGAGSPSLRFLVCRMGTPPSQGQTSPSPPLAWLDFV